MSTKRKVLEFLEENRGNSISGESIAGALNISRAAVWKIINELKNDGYVIGATRNKGYSLSVENDIISSAGIRQHLKNKELAENILIYETLESTNITAKELALKGAENGTVLIANHQTKGRGRLNRNFVSIPNKGIYMSFIFRPTLQAGDAILVTTAAAVAVCRSIEKITGIEAGIKWVNDIYVNGKKICGILTEAATDLESGNTDYIVIGIGINFSIDADMFPPEIEDIATSLYNSDTKEITRNELIAEIIQTLFYYMDNLFNEEILREYKKHSIVLNKVVQFIENKISYEGKAIEFGDRGELIVLLENGEVKKLLSSEISIKGDFISAKKGVEIQ